MADNSEQHLQDISAKIQQMVELLRVNNQQTGQPSMGSVLSSTSPGGGPAALMSGPGGPPDYVQMMMNEQANRGEKPREIVKESAPVDIMKFSPKSLKNLSNAIGGKDGDTKTQGETKESFIDGLLRSIGTPLLALAGGVTALLASANIDFGAFEGLANAIGKGGLQAGLKMFTNAFVKLSGPMLRKIPVVGALISFYYASERFKKGDTIGMAIDVASGIANLLNLVMPGIGSMLSIGLDMLNAYLDYKTSDAEDPQAAKTDLLKEMAKKTWAAVEPYIKYIPVIGSIWLGKDAYDAFKGGDVANGIIYALRAILNLAPGIGTVANIGLGFVQGMMDPNRKEENLITEGIGGLIDQFGPMFKEYLEPFIKDVPIIGGFFHAADMIKDFREGKWGTGFMSLIQTVAAFVPGFGLLLTPALSFIRGMFDDSYKGQSTLGDAGASAVDWMKGLATTAKNWFSSFIWGIIDKVVPNIFGFRSKIKNQLKEWGFAPEGATIEPDTEAEDIERAKKAEEVRKSVSSSSYGNAWTAGYRADGGPVSKGNAYVVGERGPEIFQATNSGNITSNEDITSLLQQNNAILSQLANDIVTAVRETGTVVNTSNVASTNVNTTGAGNGTSFRDSFRNSFYK